MATGVATSSPPPFGFWRHKNSWQNPSIKTLVRYRFVTAANYRSWGASSSHSQAARQMVLQGKPAFSASETVREPSVGKAT